MKAATSTSTSTGTKLCAQCLKRKSRAAFVAKRGTGIVKNCDTCRERMQLSPAERVAAPITRIGLGRSDACAPRVSFALRSGNRKLGPMPASISSAETCPPSCRFYEAGCYAEFGVMRAHWKRAEEGLHWDEFVAAVAKLPAGTVWRHNSAGDLPGRGDDLDVGLFYDLVFANRACRGFTFTHKPLKHKDERGAVEFANRIGGFTVNLSADDLEHADRLSDLDIAPVAVVVPSTTPDEGTRTPSGRRVVICPNETHGLSCLDCQLCTRTERAIVGFRAHGQMRNHVDKLVTLRRKPNEGLTVGRKR